MEPIIAIPLSSPPRDIAGPKVWKLFSIFDSSVCEGDIEVDLLRDTLAQVSYEKVSLDSLEQLIDVFLSGQFGTVAGQSG